MPIYTVTCRGLEGEKDVEIEARTFTGARCHAKQLPGVLEIVRTVAWVSRPVELSTPAELAGAGYKVKEGWPV